MIVSEPRLLETLMSVHYVRGFGELEAHQSTHSERQPRLVELFLVTNIHSPIL